MGSRSRLGQSHGPDPDREPIRLGDFRRIMREFREEMAAGSARMLEQYELRHAHLWRQRVERLERLPWNWVGLKVWDGWRWVGLKVTRTKTWVKLVARVRAVGREVRLRWKAWRRKRTPTQEKQPDAAAE